MFGNGVHYTSFLSPPVKFKLFRMDLNIIFGEDLHLQHVDIKPDFPLQNLKKTYMRFNLKVFQVVRKNILFDSGRYTFMGYKKQQDKNVNIWMLQRPLKDTQYARWITTGILRNSCNHISLYMWYVDRMCKHVTDQETKDVID